MPLRDPETVKQLIAREIGQLRAIAARSAGACEGSVPTAESELVPPAEASGQACPCGQGTGAGHACHDAAEGHDPWDCLCATLPAIPVSAALLAPVKDEDGRTVDFVIRAGNHVRSAGWLDPPDRQVGKRLLDVRPGAEASGLLDALIEVLASGRALRAHPVEYTERRPDGLHRTSLLYDAAACGGQVLATWRQARDRTELLSLEAQFIASMGWARYDLLSGETIWSDGLCGIFRTTPGRPLTLMELCDVVLLEDLPLWGRLLRALLDGEEPPGTDIRFAVQGDVRTLHVVGRPVISTDGLAWALHLIARDLTTQIRGRQRLAATRRQTERFREEAVAERRVATALREALLPTHSEQIVDLGYRVAAAYLPAEAAVGGDWYKCRALPDGRILLAIGDACGHGLSAVARMAQQRHGLAGLAHTPGSDASRLTGWLNDLMCADPAAETATAVIGHLHGDHLLTWANAGHPAPVLVRGGTASPLPTHHRGPLLGLLPGHPYETATTSLERGDLLVLYTDGLVERRDADIEEGLRVLCRHLAEHPGLGAEGTLESVMDHYATGDLSDDTCLVALEVT
ncbi:serine/threonine-protein phosphatase [Streptomyces sp. SMC 277]|uniref:Serine/threonine-protein phosphatase n=1 Tax=Streptomyces antimicrobicus TaxID=2883108 RepID=A0ABS8B6Z1_9ACTN|nr:PP2C family protein-serine/threonine phosphatase [Streptomyces antimicrobicus]MCB5180331.1 serine/threonine-protein phosphatase [Streptomyces antimicrobicus]